MAGFGLIMGSALNCLALRLVSGQKWSGKERSACPACGHVLSALDLVPLFSWLFLRGKCRYCKAPVSIRYFRIRITRHSSIVDATGAATSALGEIELYGYHDTAAEEAAAKALAEAKAAARTELETYRACKDNQDYREAQVAELDATLAKALETVESARNTDAVAAAVETARKALDAVKTHAQLTAEETEAPTEAPTEPETETPDGNEPATTEGTVTTEEPATDKADTAPETVTPSPEDPSRDTEARETFPAPAKACGASLNMGALGTALLMGALCLTRKRREQE
jgi:hypothetical protein